MKATDIDADPARMSAIETHPRLRAGHSYGAVRRAVALATGGLIAVLAPGCESSSGGAELTPSDPNQIVLEALSSHPLVGLGKMHLNEQFHEFVRNLLPELPGRVDDIVVEFGNSFYQNVADRFILDLEPVRFGRLAQIWRTAIGFMPLGDAPVYERFFRSVRNLNAGLEPGKRIRVVLGDPPVDWSRVHSAADREKIPTEDEREPFFAGVVSREVMAKGHRALLIMGGDHMRIGEYRGPGGLNPSVNLGQPNAATLLARRYPGSLFVVIDAYIVNDEGTPEGCGDLQRVEEAFSGSPLPSMARLDGTWLAEVAVRYRLLDPSKPGLGRQADAVLWLGPQEELTQSLPEARIYRSGPYARELRRVSEILSEISGQHVDLVALGLAMAAGRGRGEVPSGCEPTTGGP
jgi:hypothetical protein